MVPSRIPQKSLDQIWMRLIDEFKNPNFESQCITKLKDIKFLSTDFFWDFNQIFKTLMEKVSFHISYVQLKE